MNRIIFITVDCWRRDAFDYMSRLKLKTADWEYRDLLTAGAATNGVFPAIFASSHPDQVYNDDGAVAYDVTTLSEHLSKHGFATAGFFASNPFLGKWSDEFDTVWNDGMTAASDKKNRTETSSSKGIRFLKFEPRVRDNNILERARDWWSSESEPRFMHVHLMGPHAPYYPGFRRAWRIGPLRSYLSILGYAKRREDLPTVLRQQARRLYNECIARLDEELSKFLEEFSGETSIIITADHGEEFDHGRFGHARLYNETTRCPFLTNDEQLVPAASAIRQIDLAPTILRATTKSIPSAWEGQPASYDSTPLQPMQNKGTRYGREWFGVHDETRKLIHTLDNNGELIDEELYKIDDDPTEKNPIETIRGVDEMKELIFSFGSRFSQDRGGRNRVGLDSEVSQRLQELGYR